MMEWKAVESSRIAEVGFEEPSTLGVRFKRKDGVTEYHYENVPPRVHRALLSAESVGKYFEANIKNNPEAYPFTRIDDAAPSAPVVTSGVVEPPANGGTALAKVDNLKPEQVFVPGYMDSLLMEIRAQALEEAKSLNISTEPMRKALKSLAFRVVKSRTYIEGLHKAYTQAEKKRLATVDAEKRRICEILQGIEDEVRAPLTAWERKEEARVKAHMDAIAAIKESPNYGETEAIAELERRLTWLDSQLSRDWEEWHVAAEQAIADEIVRTTGLLQAAKQRAEEREELERLRTEASKRAEQDRLDAAAREAREQAEREAKQREQKAAAEAEAEKARLEREAQAAEQRAKDAERKAAEAAAQAIRDQEAAVEAERKRAAAEARRLQDEADARARNQAHRRKIDAEAISALDALLIPEEHNIGTYVVEAIAAGKIPHVTITY